jgi:adenylylsulfate kinase-like enzyme
VNRSPEAVAVSLNGVDNVGKTTQLRWLSRGMPGADPVGSIDRWDHRWKELAAGDFAAWWFETSSTAEHVGLMMRSHVARRRGSSAIALEDRGLPMLRAACAATAMVKEGLSVEQALAVVDGLVAGLPAADDRREVHLLLLRCATPEAEAAAALARERKPTRLYRAYQLALAEVVHLQAVQGAYDAVLTVGDLPIVHVQQQLRAQLDEAGIAAKALPAAVPGRVWVLGGMSESGKSTLGELLRDEHGVTRMKIGYLLGVAAARAGVTDLYQVWSSEEQAERLTEELLALVEASKARAVSLESAHDVAATRHLRRVLGQRCQVVYVDTDPVVRARRATETADSLSARDAVKTGRGADRIIDIADHVVDNNGTPYALRTATARLVSAVDVQMAVTPEPVERLGSCEVWLRAATVQLVDESVALVLATGSTGTDRWRTGWSDLDLLVIGDQVSASWLRDRAGAVQPPTGIKLGLSVLTTGDVAALRVPTRVVVALRRAADGTGVLYRRADYAMPVPSMLDVQRTDRAELGLVLMTTRRLLTAGEKDLDLRQVYKHLALVAKIVLRGDGHEVDGHEQALSLFTRLHPVAAPGPPEPDELISGRHDPALRRRLVDAADRFLRYVDRLDNIVRSRA